MTTESDLRDAFMKLLKVSAEADAKDFHCYLSRKNLEIFGLSEDSPGVEDLGDGMFSYTMERPK